jgi:hypothetical protein
LWADASGTALDEYASTFGEIIQCFEQSHLAEVRNGLEHYRDEHSFPASDILSLCESKVARALELADAKRFLPKAFWQVNSKMDEFGLSEVTLRDYKGREIKIRGPHSISGISTAMFSRPVILPSGNILGRANSELVISVVEQSEYSRLWNGYPRRRTSEDKGSGPVSLPSEAPVDNQVLF